MFLSVPTLVYLIEADIEVSVFFNAGEESENELKELIELDVFESDTKAVVFQIALHKNLLEFYQNLYNQPHSDCIYLPPEHI